VDPPQGFSVRHAVDEDARGIIDLYAACWGEYDDMVFDPAGEMVHLHHAATYYGDLGGSAWVAERSSDGRVSGSAAWVPVSVAGEPGSLAELQMIYVMPDARRQGLASYLVEMVERHVSGLGFERFRLWSDTRFTDAHRLYRSLGWEMLDETRLVDDLSHSIEYHFTKPLR
jgi:GNAT superfamily N-acetyltransferase